MTVTMTMRRPDSHFGDAQGRYGDLSVPEKKEPGWRRETERAAPPSIPPPPRRNVDGVFATQAA